MFIQKKKESLNTHKLRLMRANVEKDGLVKYTDVQKFKVRNWNALNCGKALLFITFSCAQRRKLKPHNKYTIIYNSLDTCSSI